MTSTLLLIVGSRAARAQFPPGCPCFADANTGDHMVAKVVVDKVLCYVVREGRLLVFRHTDYSYEQVGVEVPGGTVRVGEAPEDAALREAREETGLTGFRVVRKLGEVEYDITPLRSEIQYRHVF
ncbi:NUDIX domain-containing protein [Micromonospora sp. CA-111912]|uniref:NUDIX domain-containing protein n=1 Tax=Micromonospora sp. CA-111912 TaxID=3239955 RepID=UPI003D93EE1D